MEETNQDNRASVDRRVIECVNCGLPQIRNPHPDAGKPEHLNDVGATFGCLPCAEKRANGRRRTIERLRQWLDAKRDEASELNEVVRVLTLDDVAIQISELEKRRRREFRE